MGGGGGAKALPEQLRHRSALSFVSSNVSQRFWQQFGPGRFEMNHEILMFGVCSKRAVVFHLPFAVWNKGNSAL